MGKRYYLRSTNAEYNGMIVEPYDLDSTVDDDGYAGVLVRDPWTMQRYKVKWRRLLNWTIPHSGHGLALLPFELQDTIMNESGIYSPEGGRSWLGGKFADAPLKGWRDWAQQYIPTVAATEPDFVTRSIVLGVWEHFRRRNGNPWVRQMRNDGFIADWGRINVAEPGKYVRQVEIGFVNGEHQGIMVDSMERRLPVLGPNGYAHEYDNNYAEFETGAQFPRRLYALP